MTGKYKRVCPCGVEFETNHKRKIFCNRRCLDARNHNSPDWNDIQRNYKYIKNYNITLDTYNNILKNQNGCCAICGMPEWASKKKLHVDHDHESGTIRGILCAGCNLGIGMFKHDPDLLIKALNYVYDWKHKW